MIRCSFEMLVSFTDTLNDKLWDFDDFSGNSERKSSNFFVYYVYF